jgi:glucose/arabinose dehydrogenase
MFRCRPRAVRHATLAAAGVAAVGVLVGCVPPVDPPPGPDNPTLTITDAVGGLDKPWDVAWTPDGTMLFTQRGGGLYASVGGGVRRLTDGGADRWISGETGIMGLAVDPRFDANRRVYTCQGSTDDAWLFANSVQVIAWQIDAGMNTATRVSDPLVGGIFGTSGRHGGCRLEFDTSGMLLVGTGDAAVGGLPQNIDALNGKVLRVNPDTGGAAPGNPFASSGGARSLIWTFGHRNVQGLALRANGQVFSAEHGPDRDDEINLLVGGGNYGWNPVPGYNEDVPMTGLIPGARGALWSSGRPTLAISGMTFLSGSQWETWEGGLAVASLKASKLVVNFHDRNGTFIQQRIPPALNDTFGRLRTAQQGPDGCLYVLTDNGGGADRILKVCPS